MLPTTFYQEPTLSVARNLLGKKVVRRYQDHLLMGRIVETEAYHQDGDQAAHSYRGETARNRIMFGPAGHLYVYFIYGMHFCMNVVTEKAGVGAAVLIRALEPLAGIDTMQRLRGPTIKHRALTSGPARCCRALAVDRALDGASLQGPHIWLEDDTSVPADAIASSPRIGISKSMHLPWRFTLKNSAFLSR